MIWGATLGEDTVYASVYSDDKFINVSTGMALREVEMLIGPPLAIWTNNDGSVSRQWTKSPASTHYRLRVIVFSNEAVAEKNGYFYFD